MDMLLTGIYLLSAALALLSGRSEQAGAAVLTGAGDAVELCLRLGGSICLWSAVMELLERCGLARRLALLLRPRFWFSGFGTGSGGSTSALMQFLLHDLHQLAERDLLDGLDRLPVFGDCQRVHAEAGVHDFASRGVTILFQGFPSLLPPAAFSIP